ncbi:MULTISPECIES: glycoside hydrolase family 3 C-terminal domain-containing protein [unclassified Streptomyces]|uniref:glycoside hydrolase family 3 protein n=1 Tax=unclassified Streptomyces TaxID=2593676 RepID=UPI000823B306|nr:glycoside hydrolase family 3 C-terminal domain-containing protein [Streptomyces sp. AmelKG-D3]MYU00556.1 glycosyl hydrolase [Streptomyces sp. SID8350]SCK08217.1 beta-glucosidase [Streptomyces sp. AmelKG-D3]
MAAASSTSNSEALRRTAVDAALAALGLDDKARLLAGQDLWSLPALPAIGLRSLVMSDGPIGVRGVRWTAADPSVALPSPTALAATWDPALARRAGHLLAQEARRKGVHVLLAPTVNLHRTPLGGRHFEAYSEDPYLTGEIGTGYVRGVQDGGVGTTVKHFVANDAETDRFTVDNVVAPRPLRELYLAPFERIVRNAHPWGIMAAYNQVNGSTMTEHRYLQNAVLRGEWGFDGFIVSDWLAARTTVGALTGGLDVAMPGPRTVYGEELAAAVRAGEVDEKLVDLAVRNVLLLAARTGALETAPPAVAPADLPAPVDGDALAREIARRSFVLVRNEIREGARPGLGDEVRDEAGGEAREGEGVRDGAAVLPLAPGTTVALSGALARDARVLGGGSALVFPDHVVSPLDGLTAALPEGALTYSVGADPSDELATADAGFDLTAVCRDADGAVLATVPLPGGQIQWIGADLPEGVTHDTLDTVEITGTFTPRESGEHTFGTRGTGTFALTVDGHPLYEGTQDRAPGADPLGAFFNEPVKRGRLTLTGGTPVRVSLSHRPGPSTGHPLQGVAFSLVHLTPRRDPDELIAEAVAAARDADTAVVVVGTTERVESEGFDRTDLRLPGHQDALVRAVAAAHPRTVVVVNSGSPVELPWRDEVAAILLTWFPGQEAGHALADVLTGAEEPGGRLPTTWPAVLADAPVTATTPTDGELPYTEGVFIGYRAWEKAGTVPAYAFGHGLGYTTWAYDTLTATPGTVTVRVRNTGPRPGGDTVQIYLAPEPAPGAAPDAPERPARWLAGFARVTAAPGETVEVTVPVEPRAYQVWDEEAYGWTTAPGTYTVQAARSLADVRATTTVEITGDAGTPGDRPDGGQST